jgi:hypothetical protein
MVRVVIGAPLSTDTNLETALVLRDQLVTLARAATSTVLTGIYVVDANPIDQDTIFSYSVQTAWDMLFTLIMGAAGVAYLFFLIYVVVQWYQMWAFAKRERDILAKEKEVNVRQTLLDAADADASRFDRIDDDLEEEELDMLEGIHDPDGIAVRNVALDVARALYAPPTASAMRPSAVLGALSPQVRAALDNWNLPPPKSYDDFSRFAAPGKNMGNSGMAYEGHLISRGQPPPVPPALIPVASQMSAPTSEGAAPLLTVPIVAANFSPREGTLANGDAAAAVLGGSDPSPVIAKLEPTEQKSQDPNALLLLGSSPTTAAPPPSSVIPSDTAIVRVDASPPAGGSVSPGAVLDEAALSLL